MKGGIFMNMNELIIKNVNVLGDNVIATQDKDGQIYAGVSYFCNALGMNRVQKDTQVDKIRMDKTLSKGYRKFPVGVFDKNNEAVGIRLDFIPLWLAKISITKRMEQDNPELADKLLNYQLKAKDILAEAFLPKQETPPLTLQQQIQIVAKGTDELYQKVDKVSKDVKNVKEEMRVIKDDLPLLPLEAYEIEKAVRKKGVQVLGGKETPAYNDRGLRQRLYNDLYSNLKHNFDDVRTYKAIRRKDAGKAVQIVNDYKPPLFLSEQIASVNAQLSFDLEGGAAI